MDNYKVGHICPCDDAVDASFHILVEDCQILVVHVMTVLLDYLTVFILNSRMIMNYPRVNNSPLFTLAITLSIRSVHTYLTT